MKASWYAEALMSALSGKNEKEVASVSAHFFKVIKARGHAGLLKFIPAELEKIAGRERAQNYVSLVVSDKKSTTKWAHAYDHYEKEGIIPRGSIRQDVVDDTIVGGFQIRSKNILIDSSYKRSLADLYQNIISNK